MSHGTGIADEKQHGSGTDSEAVTLRGHMLDSDVEADIGSGATTPEEDLPVKDASQEVVDEGLTAWLVVVGAWCTSFCSFGWINSEPMTQSS